MGLPTPNIFTGGENFHGKYEYISVDNMIKATNVIIEIAQLTVSGIKGEIIFPFPFLMKSAHV